MPALLTRLTDWRFARYLAASVGALAADMGVFLALLSAHVAAPVAAAQGYAFGILVHWLLSSRAVFQDRVGSGALRTRQKALFVVSALVGLGLTTLIVAGGETLAIDPRIAKLVAIAASFTTTWLLRQRVVFAGA